MLVVPRRLHPVLATVATGAALLVLAAVALAGPVDARSAGPAAAQAAASPVHAAVGDRSVPDPDQVDAVLADLRADRAEAAAAASSDSDTDTVALVLSIAAILAALGALALSVTRPRRRAFGT